MSIQELRAATTNFPRKHKMALWKLLAHHCCEWWCLVPRKLPSPGEHLAFHAKRRPSFCFERHAINFLFLNWGPSYLCMQMVCCFLPREQYCRALAAFSFGSSCKILPEGPEIKAALICRAGPGKDTACFSQSAFVGHKVPVARRATKMTVDICMRSLVLVYWIVHLTHGVQYMEVCSSACLAYFPQFQNLVLIGMVGRRTEIGT